MPDKSFEITVKFEEIPGNDSYPIIKTIFIVPGYGRVRLPPLLDTGADGLVLHRRYEFLFGNLQPEKFVGLGGERQGRKTQGKIELFGREIDCEIGFADFELLSWRAGFLGRECLTTFGIGFWESAREIYVTLTP